MRPRERLHKELRSGYTTGTYASAVAKAAAFMLVKQIVIEHVAVTLPGGSQVILDLLKSRFNNDSASCSAIKDAGDDPDVTHGMEITATVFYTNDREISIEGGRGIGMVTKPGLVVEPGKPAINPVPFKMIWNALAEVVPENTGIKVIISFPEGEKIASKTFNEKLGIKGGLSVLGTTGIVKPMSEEALKDSLLVKLKQQAAQGVKRTVFAPGNYGKAFSGTYFNYDEEKVVVTSNFMGFMLEQAVKNGFTDIIIIGHIGKLVKLAGGIFHTHSRVADARNEIMAAHYFYFTNDRKGFESLMESNSAEEAVSLIDDVRFWKYLTDHIKMRSEQLIYNEINIEVVCYSHHSAILGMTENASILLKEVMNE